MITRECLTGLTGLTYFLSSTYSIDRERERARPSVGRVRSHAGVGARGAIWEMVGQVRPG